jgi:hypothetical protein
VINVHIYGNDKGVQGHVANALNDAGYAERVVLSLHPVTNKTLGNRVQPPILEIRATGEEAIEDLIDAFNRLVKLPYKMLGRRPSLPKPRLQEPAGLSVLPVSGLSLSPEAQKILAPIAEAFFRGDDDLFHIPEMKEVSPPAST